MATTANADARTVLGELGRTIRRLREDCPPMETARILHSYDGPGQPLVGLRHDGGRAVYYQASTREAIAVRFDAEGVDPRGGRPIATMGRRAGPDRWVAMTRYYWSWRHPRYR